MKLTLSIAFTNRHFLKRTTTTNELNTTNENNWIQVELHLGENYKKLFN